VRGRARTADPRTRDRLAMVRLADAGWSAPRLARHLSCHEPTARRHIEAFLADGFGALPDRPRAGRPPTVRAADLLAVEARRDAGGRTWTTRQLVAALQAERGVAVHPDHRHRLLRRRRFGWERTATSVASKRRDPASSDAKVAELDGLTKTRAAG
jgi:transposase